MSLIDTITSKLPFVGKTKDSEYFFAVDIGIELLTACVWSVHGDNIKVQNPASLDYTQENLVERLDKLLDQSFGELTSEPDKILFGVPESWLSEEELKEPYMKILRDVVKNLEIKPMAYVSTPHALSLLLEKEEGAPTTAILIDIEKSAVAVTVSRAGKIDGTKLIKRTENIGEDIEKILLNFAEVEVLPSRMLIYGPSSIDLEKEKSTLLSFPWMNRLSFLHFPKIDILDDYSQIQAVALAGAIELGGSNKYKISVEGAALSTIAHESIQLDSKEDPEKEIEEKLPEKATEETDDLGFISGDITKKEPEALPVEDEPAEVEPEESESEEALSDEKMPGEDLPEDEETKPMERQTALGPEPNYIEEEFPRQRSVALSDDGSEVTSEVAPMLPPGRKFSWQGKLKFILPILVLLLLVLGYIFLPTAHVTIFVEPKILEKDTQVTADPSIKEVDEANKKIPGQLVDTSISGSGKGTATGKKQVGNAAKGTVVIRNKTDESKTLSKGTTLTGPGGAKFILDDSVTIASKSADDGTWGKANGNVSAVEIGPDGNLATGVDFAVSGFSESQFVAKSEGNFSGGTSKDVTVVTDSDQKKLLATVIEDLRKKGAASLQEKIKDKKILEEALAEEVVKKSFSKNINDQASDFTLNLTVRFKGTAYSDSDLKGIVSKLVETDVPSGFELNLADSETQADVSKVDKDGKLIFLARFKAKLLPKLDQDKIKTQIKGMSPPQAADVLKSYENVLGSEIKIFPTLPVQIARLPFWEQNIKIEVSLK